MTEDLNPNLGHDDETAESAIPVNALQNDDHPIESVLVKSIGGFRIKGVIASGGMGTVYLGVQENPRRPVAVKVMKEGITSRSARRRFEYEAQSLARLRHPNIAQVYEAGTHDDGHGGLPFFAMEYIPQARSITDYATQHELDIRQRLQLFIKVCLAVHHGHQKGIIHRDLKPGNILIDSSGEPKIIDFGVARATDSDLAVTALQTEIGQIIGTVQYMSPEQLDADPHDLDTRSDVYTLGVVLFELMCKCKPYDVESVAIFDAASMIRKTAPARPGGIDRALRGDVETILLKALEKDRDRRYQSAGDLAQDIERYLQSEPISARPPSVFYQMQMFAKRNRPMFAAIVAIILALVAITTVAVIFSIAISRANERIAEALEEAQVSRWNFYLARIAAAQAALEHHEVIFAKDHLEKAPEEFRDWEWKYLNALADESLLTLAGHKGRVYFVAWSPDGAHVATASADTTVRIWDSRNGQVVQELVGHNDEVWSVAFSHDGTQLATGSKDGTIRIWDVKSGEEQSRVVGHELKLVHAVVFSKDDQQLASGGYDNMVRIWDVKTAQELHSLEHPDYIWGLAFSEDGSMLATASRNSEVRVFETESYQLKFPPLPHQGSVESVVFSPDSRLLASGTSQAQGYVWNMESGEVVERFSDHEPWMLGVAFSPTGSSLASCGVDMSISVRDLTSDAPKTVLRGHEYWVRSVAFSPVDAFRLASASEDGTAKIWDTQIDVNTTVVARFNEPLVTLTVSPGNIPRAVVGALNGATRIINYETGQTLAEISHPTGWATAAAFTQDARRFALAYIDGAVRIHDSSTGKLLSKIEQHVAVRSLVFTSNGKYLLAVSANVLILWDAQTGDPIRQFHAFETNNDDCAVHLESSKIAIGTIDGRLIIGNIETAVLTHDINAHDDTIRSVAISPSGENVATASLDSRVKIWNTATGELIHTLAGHTGPVQDVIFSKDGSRVVTASNDSTIRIWDVLTGDHLITLRGHQADVNSIAFTDKGERIVSAGADGEVRVWDVAKAGQRRIERRAQLEALRIAQPIVDELIQGDPDHNKIIQQVEADDSLSESVKQAVFDLLLQYWHSS